MKNLKTTIMTMLLVASGICAVAQEKWEYAVVTYEYGKITVTKHSVESFPHQKGLEPNSEVIIKVEELNKDGWEVYNTIPNFSAGQIIAHIYYLRKKKQ